MDDLRQGAGTTVRAEVQTDVPPKLCQVDPADVPEHGRGSWVLAARSGLYITIVLAVALGACVFSLRKYGIFACQANLYGTDRYLSYCNATSYGDYDHGAMWFGLEPAAVNAAASARALFVGDSRTQFAFSTNATSEWFSSASASYYLLGFSHEENYTFEAPLLRKLHPRAKVYVVNIESFFERSETAPGKTVMRDESARTHYEEKRKWQHIQRALCTTVRGICGSDEAIFRSRSTGTWVVTGNRFPSEPVSYNENIDGERLASYTVLGKQFLPDLTPDRACTILTVVPTVKTDIETGKGIAAGLGFNLVAPKLDGLVTFDRVHLNPESAQRWSAAFFEQAGPQIQKCLSE